MIISFEDQFLVPVGFTLLISDWWVFGTMEIVNPFLEKLEGHVNCLSSDHSPTFPSATNLPFIQFPKAVRPTQLLCER